MLWFKRRNMILNSINIIISTTIIISKFQMLSFVKKIITFLSSRIFWHNFLFILTNLLLHYLFSHFNILIIMMTIDNIYLAGNFLKNIFDENISESQIIISNNKLYSIGVIERYTCYIFKMSKRIT